MSLVSAFVATVIWRCLLSIPESRGSVVGDAILHQQFPPPPAMDPLLGVASPPSTPRRVSSGESEFNTHPRRTAPITTISQQEERAECVLCLRPLLPGEIVVCDCPRKAKPNESHAMHLTCPTSDDQDSEDVLVDDADPTTSSEEQMILRPTNAPAARRINVEQELTSGFSWYRRQFMFSGKRDGVMYLKCPVCKQKMKFFRGVEVEVVRGFRATRFRRSWVPGSDQFQFLEEEVGVPAGSKGRVLMLEREVMRVGGFSDYVQFSDAFADPDGPRGGVANPGEDDPRGGVPLRRNQNVLRRIGGGRSGVSAQTQAGWRSSSSAAASRSSVDPLLGEVDVDSVVGEQDEEEGDASSLRAAAESEMLVSEDSGTAFVNDRTNPGTTGKFFRRHVVVRFEDHAASKELVNHAGTSMGGRGDVSPGHYDVVVPAAIAYATNPTSPGFVAYVRRCCCCDAGATAEPTYLRTLPPQDAPKFSTVPRMARANAGAAAAQHRPARRYGL